MNVTVNLTDEQVLATAPYHPTFRDAARAAGGKYENNRWTFPLIAEAPIRQALLKTFKTDGTGTEPLVNVRVTMRRRFKDADDGPVLIAGKVVSTLTREGTHARVGEDVAYEQSEPTYTYQVGPRVPDDAVILLQDVTPAGLEHLKRMQDREICTYEVLT